MEDPKVSDSSRWVDIPRMWEALKTLDRLRSMLESELPHVRYPSGADPLPREISERLAQEFDSFRLGVQSQLEEMAKARSNLDNGIVSTQIVEHFPWLKSAMPSLIAFVPLIKPVIPNLTDGPR